MLNGSGEVQNMDREAYEQAVQEQLTQWRHEINTLYSKATDRDVTDSVGDEHTQVEKLQGQLEMAEEQFKLLRSLDTADAWEDLRPGVDEKLERFNATLAKTRQQIRAD
jgi:Zn-dependent oligopeptidase